MVQRNVAFDSRALVSGSDLMRNTGSAQAVSPFISQPSQSIYVSRHPIRRGKKKQLNESLRLPT